MNCVLYEIVKASNTGKYGQTYDNIKETDTSTVWEVEAEQVSVDLGFEACIIAKIVLTIKTSMAITVELKGKVGVIQRESRREVFEKDLKTAVFDFSSTEKAAKASIRFERLGKQPIRVVSVVLMPRKAGEITPSAQLSAPITPQKRGIESPSKTPEKRQAIATYVLGDLAASPMGIARHSASQPRPALIEHTKLKAQPVTQPYSQALLGVSIAVYADSPMLDVLTGLIGVMGAIYKEYPERGVDFLVLEDCKRDRKVVERAEKLGIKAVTGAWLLACRDANEQISHREYLVG